MSRDVLQSDPSFQALLDRRDALERQVDDLREQLVAARSTADQQIRALQRQFQDTRARLQEQMRGLTKQLEPECQRLQLDISTAWHQIHTHEAAVQGLKKTVTDLMRSLNRSAAPSTAPPMASRASDGVLPPTGGPMAAADHSALDSQLADTQHELQRAESELAQRRAHLKILEYKLRLLRVD